MKETHEKFFRGLPGAGICYVCQHSFPSMIELAFHIEQAHPQHWAVASAASEKVERLQLRREKLLGLLERVENDIQHVIAEFHENTKKTYNVSNRN